MTSWFCKGIIVVYFFLTMVPAAHAEDLFMARETFKRLKAIEQQAIDKQQQAIDQLKIYLREMKSIAVDFTQVDSAGTRSEGKLLINKPSKFRCNYYPPFPLVIIGNANYVSVYDYDMKHVSRIKAEENVFNFLLEDVVDFDKYFKIESTIDQDNMFEVIIYHTLSERRSQIIFDKETKQMKMLKILEDDNVITIKFNHIAKVQKFDDDLFKLKHPDIFGAPNRLNKSDIEKKYNLAS